MTDKEPVHKPTLEKQTPARPLPGDRDISEQAKRMIRVDHAGEFGAVRIYAGQRAIMGDKHPKAGLLKHMYEQEEVHLERFNKFIRERGVRPTIMAPFWHVAGFALGAGTALMGEKAAMACTQAVEEVIDDHYQHQLDTLDGADPELEEMIEVFQAEEVEHKRIAEEHGAEEAPGYPVLSAAIKAGCKAAIWISKRV
ncbi:demethoxyubiquinone hydroxylase family protein [Kordiimonas sp. SCSIO 12603]|uniref:demethoxyubiquinone hydroxylase family protein n=1 Tax=Kordiimonas sp. SCSIO 12603 TaxID=2829596 RepID=UPI002105046C|nr:demethoxyubiquinone hydroxylase family protein [Kordiimonas sp. SCSIO 12603]UTW58469.1 demethoxyubiquinone hydroxylase family protein [Kordiimonas sp. SCSIO 12603]